MFQPTFFKWILCLLLLATLVKTVSGQSVGTKQSTIPAPLLAADRRPYITTDSLFQAMLALPDVHNGFFSLGYGAKTGSADWHFVAGQTNDVPYTLNTTFHSTSVGKLITATLVMQLVEADTLRLEASIAEYLPPEVIAGLHRLGGRDESENITIQQLLSHHSGLGDHLMDAPAKGGVSLLFQALNNPRRLWRIDDFLAAAKQLSARSAPGTEYYYSDTNYLLLGMILEARTGLSLADLAHQRLFRPLGMTHTTYYLHDSITTPTSLSGCYLGERDLSETNVLSIDWAGGGLATTSTDLINFSRALWSGQLLRPASLERMQDWTPESHGTTYGLGLRRLSLAAFSPDLPPLQLIGHTGSSGSFLFYCPELDVHLAGTFNQTERVRDVTITLLQTVAHLWQYANATD